MTKPLLALFCLFNASAALAFPEMVRHGYVNCTTCHISPDGGGVLTPYGRGLSREVLSADGQEGEGQFLYGAFKEPQWLSLGGDVRGIQTIRDTATMISGRFIFMQAQAEANAEFAPGWRFDLALGKSNAPDQSTVMDRFYSPRHYLMYQPIQALSIRAGRFPTAFGIHTADHAIVTKRNLGWDEGTEPYNLEVGWTGDKFDAFLTAVLGRIDTPSQDNERGFAFRASINADDAAKVGISYLNGTTTQTTRHVAGPYAIIGITRRLVFLAEIDVQAESLRAGGTDSVIGIADYLKLSYEISKGIEPYVSHELFRHDIHLAQGMTDVFTLGVQYFPRPHLELNLAYQRARNQNVSPDYVNFTWLMGHFYL